MPTDPAQQPATGFTSGQPAPRQNRPLPKPFNRNITGTRVTLYVDVVLSCGHQQLIRGMSVNNSDVVGCVRCRDEYVKEREAMGETFDKPEQVF